MDKEKQKTECFSRSQRTLKAPVAFEGVGIHSGKKVIMRLCPAVENTGLSFKRMDLPGKPEISVCLENVVDTTRSTTLAKGDALVHTVEHVLAALKAYQIDNAVIELSGPEIPIADGSARAFVDLIEKAGFVIQQKNVRIIQLIEPVFWQENEQTLAALPFEGFRLSYSLHYPQEKVLNHQFSSHLLSSENFKKDIAPCRTFSMYEEVEFLLAKGLIKGGSLSNTLIIHQGAVISEGGLHFENEMARHKVLDMAGDFSLMGIELHAHIIGNRTGHRANILFAKKLLESLIVENQDVYQYA